jgi:phosphonate transport system substrate-binding protein
MSHSCVKSLLLALSLTLAATCASADTEMVFGVSEGTSGGTDHARVVAKYGGLADALARALKRKVNVVFLREFSSLEDGMRSGRLDLLMARPSDYPARGMRDHGYQFVASAKPDGQCIVIAAKNSPLAKLEDARGKRWVMPEQVSFMSRFCKAELRDRGILVANEKVQYVREQGAVPFYLDNNFANVGVVASYSGVAKNLEKTGHKVLHRSVPQPYFPLVAHRRITPDQVRAMQLELAKLKDSDAGREILSTVGITAFETQGGERMLALLTWLAAEAAPASARAASAP